MNHGEPGRIQCFRTCRPDGTLRLVEVDTGLLKRQTTIIKNTPDLALQIVDDIFMLDA